MRNNTRTVRLIIEITATPRVPTIEAGSTDAAEEICKLIVLEAGLAAQRLVGPEYQISVADTHVIY